MSPRVAPRINVSADLHLSPASSTSMGKESRSCRHSRASRPQRPRENGLATANSDWRCRQECKQLGDFPLLCINVSADLHLSPASSTSKKDFCTTKVCPYNLMCSRGAIPRLPATSLVCDSESYFAAAAVRCLKGCR